MAPIPETILPNANRRKLLLKPARNVPIIIRTNEAKPTFFPPKRSEIIPLGMVKNMPGNAKRLISKPAWA